MNGLPNLAPGLSASVFAGGYTSMSSKGTATWASPQGPQTATQAGWGTVAGGSGSASRVTHGVLSAGAISLALLIFIWWSLPR
jgi:hypothetical protein